MPDHPLSEPYQKARKQYALFSGLLIAWELVGFDIKDTAYFSVKSPQAAPFVLMALVAYFAGRTGLEWWHLDEEARKRRPSKIDYWSAHCIAVAGVGLYVIQRVLEIQVAETQLAAYPRVGAAFAGFAIGFQLPWAVVQQSGVWRTAGVLGWLGVVLISVLERTALSAVWFWPSLGVGALVGAFYVWALWRVGRLGSGGGRETGRGSRGETRDG